MLLHVKTKVALTTILLISIVFFTACSGKEDLAASNETIDKNTKWQKDIHYLSKELEAKHKNMYHTISKKEFKAQKEKLIKALPQLTEMEKIIGLKSLVAKIEDGHTAVYDNTLIHLFPFKVMTFEEGIYIINAPEAYADLIGTRIKQIGNLPVDDIIMTLSDMVSRDNAIQRMSNATNNLFIAEYLKAYGIISDINQADMVFETIEGQEKTVTIESTMDLNKLKWTSIGMHYKDISNMLYVKNTRASYWFEYLSKEKIIYFQYNQCFSNEDNPIDDFIERLLKFIHENEVEKFIFDMRHNSGGNSMLIEPLIKALAKNERINQQGKLYVVIGKRTFSSAVLNALTLQKQTEAILIGKPSGGRPNHYGEVKNFTLPYLGYEVTYSTKYFRYSDKDTDSIYPDIEITYTFNDFIHGIDPVLQTILEQ